MKYTKFLPVFILILSAIACIEDTIQLENLSNDLAFEREIPMPIITTSLTFDDIAGHGYDSLIILQVGDTIFLYLNEDLNLDDTIEFGETGENMDFDFINIHYKIFNMFPVGLDFRITLYDSVSNQNIDTIWFSNTPGELFIQPPPIDENGLTIEEEVDTSNSFIGLTATILDELFNETTHLIVFAGVPATGGFVKILNNYRLYLQLGIDAKGRYELDPDSIQ